MPVMRNQGISILRLHFVFDIQVLLPQGDVFDVRVLLLRASYSI
jgi:hypothetical protein